VPARYRYSVLAPISKAVLRCDFIQDPGLLLYVSYLCAVAQCEAPLIKLNASGGEVHTSAHIIVQPAATIMAQPAHVVCTKLTLPVRIHPASLPGSAAVSCRQGLTSSSTCADELLTMLSVSGMLIVLDAGICTVTN